MRVKTTLASFIFLCSTLILGAIITKVSFNSQDLLMLIVGVMIVSLTSYGLGIVTERVNE